MMLTHVFEYLGRESKPHRVDEVQGRSSLKGGIDVSNGIVEVKRCLVEENRFLGKAKFRTEPLSVVDDTLMADSYTFRLSSTAAGKEHIEEIGIDMGTTTLS